MSSSESLVSLTDDSVTSSDKNDSSLSDAGLDTLSEEDDLIDQPHLKTQLLEEDRKLTAALRKAQNIEDNFDEERLNIEKTILSTTLAMKQILYNFKKMYELNYSKVCRIGAVTLSNVKADYIYGPNSSYIQHYFLCALTLNNDCSLFLSQICEASTDGVVDFNINHTFSDLQKDFEIYIDIYVLKVETQSLSRKLKQKIDKLFDSKENSNEDIFRRSSLFEFWKRTMISIAEVNRTKEIGVEIVGKKFRKIFADIAGVVDTSSFFCKSWMSVRGPDRFWEDKWCVLRGTRLECFDGVVEDQDTTDPVISIDLKSCVDVKICPVNRQDRNRILRLTIKNGDFKYDFCMRTNSRYHFKKWKKLRKYIATLKDWKEANCLID